MIKYKNIHIERAFENKVVPLQAICVTAILFAGLVIIIKKH